MTLANLPSSAPLDRAGLLVLERLAAARRGDRHAFDALVEPHRRELQVHCYRLLGSVEDAEDAVQETLLRAWRRLDTYAGRAPFRAWLYRIATNVGLDALDRRARRSLPQRVSPPAAPNVAPQPFTSEPVWLEPLPDEWLAAVEPSPEARYATQESVRLAFLAALQRLPGRQRAVLILRDVLDWRAVTVAEALSMTVSAVNSALHRARVTLAREVHGREVDSPPPSSAELAVLLDRYVTAWEASDVDALVALLRDDAILTMPPSHSWYQGRAAIGRFLGAALFAPRPEPRWRLLPTRANGQPGFGMYEWQAASGDFRPSALHVLTFAGPRLTEAHLFVMPQAFSRFGLPPSLPA